ncbi:hypothetical protein Q1695_015248 [Nippostrongylus brasiliensis]|nr:hypothetical protein Q1695_015248 [Nippostrongylus brasiliensis]
MRSLRRRDQNAPRRGIKEAHSDFVSCMYDDHGPTYSKCVSRVETAFGLPREKVAYVAFCLLAVYLVIGAAAEIVCNFIGFGYPAYMSVKAVRSKSTEDDTQWLIYWCVFAAFSLVDFFASSIMQYFPFYYLAKVIFLIFLFLPQTMGAQYLFENYVDPLVTSIDKSRAKKSGPPTSDKS